MVEHIVYIHCGDQQFLSLQKILPTIMPGLLKDKTSSWHLGVSDQPLLLLSNNIKEIQEGSANHNCPTTTKVDKGNYDQVALDCRQNCTITLSNPQDNDKLVIKLSLIKDLKEFNDLKQQILNDNSKTTCQEEYINGEKILVLRREVPQKISTFIDATQPTSEISSNLGRILTPNSYFSFNYSIENKSFVALEKTYKANSALLSQRRSFFTADTYIITDNNPAGAQLCYVDKGVFDKAKQAKQDIKDLKKINFVSPSITLPDGSLGYLMPKDKNRVYGFYSTNSLEKDMIVMKPFTSQGFLDKSMPLTINLLTQK